MRRVSGDRKRRISQPGEQPLMAPTQRGKDVFPIELRERRLGLVASAGDECDPDEVVACRRANPPNELEQLVGAEPVHLLFDFLNDGAVVRLSLIHISEPTRPY